MEPTELYISIFSTILLIISELLALSSCAHNGIIQMLLDRMRNNLNNEEL